jgi:hypothetical protein
MWKGTVPRPNLYAIHPVSLPSDSVALALMQLGTRVEVRSRFDQRWARGFEIAEVLNEPRRKRYRLRRRSDGSVLPAEFVDDDVREEKKRTMWWVA